MTLHELYKVLNDGINGGRPKYGVVLDADGTSLTLGGKQVARVRTDDDQHVVQVYFLQSATVESLRHVKARLIANPDITVA